MARAKSAIPNAFTLSNLGCGVLSLLMTFQENFKWACLFILIAGFIDRYDGRVARALNVSSELGKELDSLADLVSFGVAPALLVFNMYNLTELGVVGYMIALMFPIAGAYRLARYNVSTFNGAFTGVPITIAGMLLSLYSLLTLNKPVSVNITIVLMIILSYLMISKLKLKKV